ncbi:MAG: DUF4038 domain-containing protein [Candidatus Brockarchaeota archaeon]|nr:DUF4038 domain-containing protein [Candidatus Brockarchaeota archaeon]
MQNSPVEFSLQSKKEYRDPFSDVEVSATFMGPDGEERTVPAFWAGNNAWRVRYASHQVGKHSFRTSCSDVANPGLHGRTGSLEVVRYEGRNPLLKHGPLKVSKDRRHLEHEDGTPFFWLGDTWWMGLSKRLRWPEEFKLLTRDRVGKGFTVVQIVAGLYPDMPPFDPRGANEAGFPWERGFSRINPAYFDAADRRIWWLVRSGLVPCIVGSWGYYIKFAGEEVMKKHWRNLVARYGAFPSVWCLAGEATMPYYVSQEWGDREKREKYVAEARAGWTGVARYLRSLDPYRRPVTIHPTDCARNMVDDPAVIDFDMLQTGHSDVHCFENTVRSLASSIASSPRMPVLVGEVTYEGIMGASWDNVQRLMFWASVLSGAAGHTYGANGIWQVNRRGRPFGPSPHGRSWGDAPWDEARKLPGSRELGLGKKLLESYRWWMFEPHPEWVEPHWSEGDYFEPYAAGIPGEVRVIYVPWHGQALWGWFKVKELEPGVSYRAFFFDPRTGRRLDPVKVEPDRNREWRPPLAPLLQDWVLVLEASS